LSLLDLPPELLERIGKAEISRSAAEELIPIKDPDKLSRIADLIVKNHYSSRQVRRLVEMNQGSRCNSDEEPLILDLPGYQDKILDIQHKAHRSFDKSITSLKIAMNKIGTILEGIEDNWIVYEILLQHKNMLNYQIDLLIREKKKLR
jgi:ParB family transcriptional regulator, chromosome partitioning protein